ncbi:MAG: PilZ domain-containing protein [Pseudomonadales bacterium]|nr:PilZ domain-containing protein [Pseudomonadales bacterium]
MVKKASVELSALHFNGRERRKSPRVRYDIGTYLEGSEGVLEVRLIDISLSGCSFSSASWQPEVGECLDLKIILPDCASLLQIKVEVCSRLGLKSGVKFTRMDSASSAQLKQALHSKDRASAPPGYFGG